MPSKWKNGILGERAEINYLGCKKLLQTDHFINPSFHYSNWGEAPKFDHRLRLNRADPFV
jgi:hypothetical protein